MLFGPFPARPSLEHLRKQAKELRDQVRAGDRRAIKMALEFHPRWEGVSFTAAKWATFTLADAQLVIARLHGMPSWRRLREFVVVVARHSSSPQRRPAGGEDLVDEFLRLACLTSCCGWKIGDGEEADDLQRQVEARRLLAERPRLASATIHTAAVVGDVAAAGALLAEDESVANQVGGPHNWPPLLYLAFSRLDSTEADHSTLAVARLLLAHGADPNAGFLPDGEPPPVTALSGAFRGRNDPVNQPPHQYSLPLARLLLEAGADPNDGQAVSNVSGYPHDDSGMALLLEHGLGRRSSGPWRTLVRRDYRYQLPSAAGMVKGELSYAAQADLVDRVRLLLRRCVEIGVDLDAAADGPDACHTPYEHAVVNGNPEIVDLLIQAGATATPLDPTFHLVGACQRGDHAEVRRLLAGDPNLAERALNTPWWPHPLHQAAALNRPEAVKLLVSVGFPVNERKGSALHVAALLGQLEIVKLLVELDADPAAEAIEDNPGGFVPGGDRTPVGWARYFGHREVIAYLTGL
jgi:hypothetical protein